jgi:hypothetical protein
VLPPQLAWRQRLSSALRPSSAWLLIFLLLALLRLALLPLQELLEQPLVPGLLEPLPGLLPWRLLPLA